jgi:ferredoxin-NADP reductase
VPGGRMSNWIHDHLAEGDLVRCFGPAGHFTAGQPPRGQPRRLLLVAGGAGIVPLAAIARQVLHDEDQAQVTLVHGSASLDRMIYVAALNDLAARHAPRLRLLRVLESPPPGWTEASGRLDRATLMRLLANVDLASQHRAMVCGPDAMRAAVCEALVSAGLPAERIVEESFVSPRRAEVPALPQEATFVPAGRAVLQAFTVAAGHTLLEAALDAGIRIPFSFCSGGCGACRVRIEAAPGVVQLDQPNPVSPADLAEGRVPACLVRLAGPCRFTLA